MAKCVCARARARVCVCVCVCVCVELRVNARYRGSPARVRSKPKEHDFSLIVVTSRPVRRGAAVSFPSNTTMTTVKCLVEDLFHHQHRRVVLREVIYVTTSRTRILFGIASAKLYYNGSLTQVL